MALIRITRSIHMTNAVFRFGKNEALRFLLSLSALYNNDKIDKMVINRYGIFIEGRKGRFGNASFEKRNYRLRKIHWN